MLEFDHADGTDKVDSVSGMLGRLTSWQSILDEIAKREVRCTTCHRIRTCETRGHYRAAFEAVRVAEERELAVARLTRLLPERLDPPTPALANA